MNPRALVAVRDAMDVERRPPGAPERRPRSLPFPFQAFLRPLWLTSMGMSFFHRFLLMPHHPRSKVWGV